MTKLIKNLLAVMERVKSIVTKLDVKELKKQLYEKIKITKVRNKVTGISGQDEN
jgi:hypothetical protein